MRRLIVGLLLVSGCADRSLGTDGADSSGGGMSEVTSDSDGTPTSGAVTVTTVTTDPSMPGTLTDPDPSSATTPTTATVTTSPPDPTVDTITTTSTTDMTASATDTDGSCQDPPGQPNDGVCSDPSGCGCASGKCFVIPILGGWCGECLGDGDCSPGGCTIPDPISSVGSHCNKGEPGAGCESDAVCSDPQHPRCGAVLDVENIFTVATCGACVSNVDCPPAAHNCTPVYDIPTFSGVFECLPDDAVPSGGGCNLADNGQGQPIGDEVCASGRCGTANVMGLLKVGVCGECNSDADCPGNAPNCQEPQVDLDAGVLVPAFCL
jgi:hypothetical protein